MKVALVIGTRPQIIKSAPIIHESKNFPNIELFVIHTGQHYDYEMSKVFFNELSLPDPIKNLGVGSGSHGKQTGRMLIELEKTFLEYKPDVVLVPGDTNSTLAGALAAVKQLIPVAHIESGARSFDMTMPEEVNRVLTDHCSQVLFTVSENCSKNLRREGIPEERIVLVGDTMYESVQLHKNDIKRDDVLEEFSLKSKEFLVLTVHRTENVDDPSRLKSIIGAMIDFGEDVVFPCHPRTKKQLENIGLWDQVSKKLRLMEPVSYFRMLNLIKNAKVVFTDSGGMQKESLWMGTPCLTLRDNTEWMETIECGVNLLCGADPSLIKEGYEKMIKSSVCNKNPFDIGGASKNLIAFLTRAPLRDLRAH